MGEIADEKTMVVGFTTLHSYTLASTVVVPISRHGCLVVSTEIEVILVYLDKVGSLGPLFVLVYAISIVGIGLFQMEI